MHGRGLHAAYQLLCQAGGQLGYDDDTSSFTLTNLPGSCQIAGSVSGTWDIDRVIAEARRAGTIAGNAVGTTQQPVSDAQPKATPTV